MFIILGSERWEKGVDQYDALVEKDGHQGAQIEEGKEATEQSVFSGDLGDLGTPDVGNEEGDGGRLEEGDGGNRGRGKGEELEKVKG